jgi:hypothetical protein
MTSNQVHHAPFVVVQPTKESETDMKVFFIALGLVALAGALSALPEILRPKRLRDM